MRDLASRRALARSRGTHERERLRELGVGEVGDLALRILDRSREELGERERGVVLHRKAERRLHERLARRALERAPAEPQERSLPHDRFVPHPSTIDAPAPPRRMPARHRSRAARFAVSLRAEVMP